LECMVSETYTLDRVFWRRTLPAVQKGTITHLHPGELKLSPLI